MATPLTVRLRPAVTAKALSERLRRLENETCVSVNCKNDTGVSRSLHIDERPHYIVGSGQLCPECWRRLYG